MSSPDATELKTIADVYRKFSDEEAAGRSPRYASLTRSVSEDIELLGFLSSVPAPRRQPNLLLAVARYLASATLDWTDFKRFVLQHSGEVRAALCSRTTQTNEPNRCAVLLPLLATLKGPLALIEVGASAGLCLLPDHYRYEYDGVRVAGMHAGAAAPTFGCHVHSPAPGSVVDDLPMPPASPEIIWRAGLDLNPLDVASEHDTAWLEALVWPEQVERLENLRAAIAVARDHPPRVVRGNLLSDLAALAAEAPRDATLVVFHTAVLAYLPVASDRAAFAASVTTLADHWISNEWASVMPPQDASIRTSDTSHFLLMLDGSPIAWTDPHGTSMRSV